MAFGILLQQNLSEPERIDKSVSNLLVTTGELKEESSVIDPIILAECDLGVMALCNYMTISVFNRSYFVRNIRSVRNRLVEFTCHVDVLSTWKAQIKENNAIIRRQENEWNLYLNDGSFRIYQNPIVLTKKFPSGFSAQEFVLAVAGG